jgi:tRNA threonylcarbamoyl adenosine modification protein YeaZ
MILAIDSSMGTSVAVVADDGRALSSVASDDPRAHAELIGVLLERALVEAGVTAAEITGVAMGIGPGGFTGLRVGMAAAEAFALSRGVDLYPVVSHDALGWASDHNVVVITDARRGEVAYSVYSPLLPMRRIFGPALSTPAELDTALGEWATLPRIQGTALDAAALGAVAVSMTAAHLPLPSRAPLYLRVPDVTVAT